MIQNNKKFCPSCSISQKPYIISLPSMVHMCKMISPRVIFIFSTFWFFGLFGGLKGKKNGPKWQKNSVCCTIPQEPYIIWLSFMVHICKMIISSGVFFIFSKFWFSGSIGLVKRQKTVMTKILSVVLHISEIMHHMIVIYGANM